MVLSNKKLKQRIRSLLAESAAAAESGNPPRDAASAEDVKLQLQNLKEILTSKSHRRPRPRRKAGKRKRLSSPDEGGHIGGSADSNSKKKRKSEEEEEEEGQGDAESTDQKQQEEEGEEKKKKEEKKKRKKKKKKKKKKKEGGDDEEEVKKNGSEDGRSNDGRNEEQAAETAAISRSEENSHAVRKVYVGGIPYYSTEDDIRSFFEGCGTVTEVDCMAFPESGKFRGIAILTFKTEAAAKRALALDGADMGGLYLKIQPYKGMRNQKTKTDFSPAVMDGYNRIYIGNLSWDVEEDDLRKLFSECKISSIRFGEDKVTGEFKGYAHVDFEDSPSLAVALKLDQSVVCGRSVRIRCAVPEKGAETKNTKEPAGKSDVNGNQYAGGAKKKKRQTCYECGVPGHLSSSCPKKNLAEAAKGSS